MDKKRILIVDDDKNISELLNIYLTDAGFETFQSYDGSSALSFIKNNKVDLVLLDIMLPVIDGWEVCKLIRRTNSVPIIMLTARDMLEDKIQGFELGADDYVVKPFQPKEVVARVRARLRSGIEVDVEETDCSDGVLEIGNLRVDIACYEVYLNGVLIELKPKEVQLLHFFMLNRNIVFTRENLLDKVWNYDFMGETRTVDVHIKRLREKLDSSDASWVIKTVWGVGYKFEVR
jgi:DNA-binding response OmpR family regulator